MNLSHIIFPILLPAFVLGLFVYALLQIGKAVYHLNKAVNNTIESHTPLNGGMLFFSPSSFNPDGQAHLLKSKRHLRKLLYSVLTVLAFMVIVNVINHYTI